MKCRILLLALLSAAIFAACDKDKVTTGTTDGFGASNKPLTGTPFTFPAGIMMSGNIIPSQNNCSSNYFYDFPADGDLDFYMTLHNSNSTPTTIVLPAGLVLPCSDTTVQGGVIVQPDTFVMPAQTIYCVRLNAHCLNAHRGFSRSAIYSNPLISDNAKLQPLLQMLAVKRTVTNDANGGLQRAVWNVADSGRLMQSDIDYINSLP